jgi:hypothetical protein
MTGQVRQHPSSWIVVGALAGFVTATVLVALTAVLVDELRDVVFHDQLVLVLFVPGTAGLVLGGAAASRAVRSTPGVQILFASLSGGVLGAAAAGSLFLAAVVAGDGWPDGLQAFLTGAVVGGVIGAFLGGMLGSVSPQAVTSRRDAR